MTDDAQKRKEHVANLYSRVATQRWPAVSEKGKFDSGKQATRKSGEMLRGVLPHAG
jgi:hypothetical protein